MDYRWVQLLILWALYYKEVHLALYSILVYMALSLVASTTNLRSLYVVLALAAVAIAVLAAGNLLERGRAGAHVALLRRVVQLVRAQALAAPPAICGMPA